MECEHKKGRIRANEEEDRICSLSKDLIHHILSFIDARYAVQTSVLSTSWKHIWASLPHLNFDCRYFLRLRIFSKFVNRFLSRRNNDSNISTINFHYEGSANELVRKIARYAISHNTQQLNIDFGKDKFPISIFSSPFLKHLRLKLGFQFINYQNSSWNLPALTTLYLQHIGFGSCYNDDASIKSIDLFSKFVNLKTLTLNGCDTGDLKVFNIISLGLESLTISDMEEILTCEFVVSPPNLSSFTYEGNSPLLLSTHGLRCLDKVTIHMIWGFFFPPEKQNERFVREFVSMFSQLSNAMFLTLTWDTVWFLSKIPDLLENHSSPFINLKCLKLEKGPPIMSNEFSDVIAYFLNSSPTATVINKNVFWDR